MQHAFLSWRRVISVVMYVVTGVLVVMAGMHVSNADAADGTFTIAVLPDTQHYVMLSSRAPTFTQQTRWIVDHKQEQNIVFVTHEGDVVDSGAASTSEWQRADQSMDLLDGVVPYSVVMGNHDYNRPGSRSSGASTYLSYFGPQRYSGRSWYGGASSNKLNQYQIFQAGRWTFLHLGLELEAPDTAIAWAQSVINKHPGLPTIVTTHAYQNDTTGRTGKSQFQGNSGEQIWQKLIKPNKQIFMVLNGHFHENDGERHQVSYNAAGLPVYEMIANYQQYPNGGDGYMRLIQFDPAGARIRVKTYSPKLATYKPDWDSQFNFSVDLYKRFGTSTVSTAGVDITATDDNAATPGIPTETLTPTDTLTATATLTTLEPTNIIEATPMPTIALPTDAPTPAPLAAPQAVFRPPQIWLPMITQ